MPKDGDSFFYIARSIFNSDVWSGDPHLAKLWIYLLGKALFKKNSPEQGTLTTSLRRIQQDNPYLDPGGIIKRFWSRHKIVNMLEELEEKQRIVCKGTPKGTLINITKYKDYQDLNRYKGTLKGKQKGHRGDTGGTLTPQDSNENDTSKAPKNVKNVKEIKHIVEFLNSTLNSSFRWQTLKTQSLINARLNEKRTMEDFKLVIEFKKKDWENTEQEKYLRPKTLFNESNFEDYLNQARTQKNKSKETIA